MCKYIWKIWQYFDCIFIKLNHMTLTILNTNILNIIYNLYTYRKTLECIALPSFSGTTLINLSKIQTSFIPCELLQYLCLFKCFFTRFLSSNLIAPNTNWGYEKIGISVFRRYGENLFCPIHDRQHLESICVKRLTPINVRSQAETDYYTRHPEWPRLSLPPLVFLKCFSF